MEDLKVSKYICVEYDETIAEMYKKFGVVFKVVEIIELEESVN